MHDRYESHSIAEEKNKGVKPESKGVPTLGRSSSLTQTQKVTHDLCQCLPLLHVQNIIKDLERLGSHLEKRKKRKQRKQRKQIEKLLKKAKKIEQKITLRTEILRRIVNLDQKNGKFTLEQFKKQESLELDKLKKKIKNFSEKSKKIIERIDGGKESLISISKKIENSINMLSEGIVKLNNAGSKQSPINDQNEITCPPSLINLGSFFKESSLPGLLQSMAYAKNINLTFENDHDDNVYILLNEEAILDTIQNLVANAIKFTPQGGSITVRFLMNKETIDILVVDTGIGMTSSNAQRLFGEGIQVHTREQEEKLRAGSGSGKGLLSSRELITAMGGTLVVDKTEVNAGTTFKMSFPKTGKVMFKGKVEVNDPKPWILVAEDNLANQKLIQRQLTKAGYHVDGVENGALAAFAAQKFKYSLILMDVEMPVMDGIEATQTIKANNINTPIVALTGHGHKEKLDEITSAGMQDYILKPVSNANLLEKIEKNRVKVTENVVSSRKNRKIGFFENKVTPTTTPDQKQRQADQQLDQQVVKELSSFSSFTV